MGAVTLEHLVKTGGRETRIADVSATLEPGLHVLLGRALAGKTTLLRLIAGLDEPTSGRVWRGGEDITHVGVRRRDVAMVYQQFVNYPSMTVYENIASPLRVGRRVPRAKIDRRVREAAERLHLTPLLDRLPAELSGGQQQRTALARALVKDAGIVLLDEPLANLDYKLREELRREIRDVFRSSASVVVVASSDPTEALALGGSTLVLDEGRLLQHGGAREVWESPRSERVAEICRAAPPAPHGRRTIERDRSSGIALHGVGHSYDDTNTWAVNTLDHVFERGSFTALLGPSGCGKTTLLKLVSGLLRPTTGSVAFGGHDVTELRPERRNVAQVFQFPVVYDTMTVRENLTFPLRNRGLPAAEVRSRVHEVAELLDLTGELYARAGALAPYARQRTAIGRGLVRRDVAAVLLDEPLAALDPAAKHAMQRNLRDVHEQLDVTFVYVTHDQGEALAVADRVLVMNEGRVEQDGTPDELLETPASAFVGHFIGSPGMSFLPCSLEVGAVVVGDARVELPPDIAARARSADGELTLGVRPEHVTPARSTEPGALSVSIVDVEDRGQHRVFTLQSGSHELRMTAGDGAVAVADVRSVRFANVSLFAGGVAV